MSGVYVNEWSLKCERPFYLTHRPSVNTFLFFLIVSVAPQTCVFRHRASHHGRLHLLLSCAIA